MLHRVDFRAELADVPGARLTASCGRGSVEIVKKSKIAKPVPLAKKPVKRIFGSAKGLIVFKKGWDAPMTKREFDEFLSG